MEHTLSTVYYKKGVAYIIIIPVPVGMAKLATGTGSMTMQATPFYVTVEGPIHQKGLKG
jgi:hypothetical protein